MNTKIRTTGEKSSGTWPAKRGT